MARSSGRIYTLQKPLNNYHQLFRVATVLIALISYINTLSGDFVFDDQEAIVTNLDVRPSAPVSGIFVNDFWGYPLQNNDSHKSYRPITTLTFRWNFYLGRLNPIGYHLVNIILHAVVCGAFLEVAGIILKDFGSASRVAALLFAVHPIHTEAVANIVGRAEVLSGAFFLLAFLTYCKSLTVEGKIKHRPIVYSMSWMFVCICCCLCAVLCKEQGITVIGICIMFDVVFICQLDVLSLWRLSSVLRLLRSKWFKSLCHRLVCLLVVLVVIIIIRIFLIARGVPTTFVDSDNPTSFHPDVWTRGRTYLFLCAFNAWLLLCPTHLCFDWSMDSIPRLEEWDDNRNLLIVAFFGALFAMLIFCVKFVSITPKCRDSNENIVQSMNSSNGYTASKISYRNNAKPSTSNGSSINGHAGSSLTASVGKDGHRMKDGPTQQSKLIKDTVLPHEEKEYLVISRPKQACLLSLCFLIFPFLPACNLFFPVGFVVAERVLYLPSMGYCMLVALGMSLLFQHTSCKVDEDVDDSEDESSPSHWRLGLNNFGAFSLYIVLFLFTCKTLVRNSEWSGTESLARSGISVNPANAKVHLTLGNVLAEKGLRSCEKHYREALRLRPNYTLALGNLGLVLLNTGRADEAEYNYRKALAVRPHSGDINIKLAHLLRVGERWREAEEQYRKAISIVQPDGFLYYHYAFVLEKRNKLKEALNAYQTSSQLQPHDSKAHLALGKLLATGEDLNSSSLATGKRAKKAEQSLRKGLSLSPNDKDSRLLLGRLLLVNRQLDTSESEFRQVLQQDSNNLNALFFLAKVLETRNLLKEASSFYKRCLEINPQFKDAVVARERITKSLMSKEHEMSAHR